MYLMLKNKEVLYIDDNIRSYKVLNNKLLPHALYMLGSSTMYINDLRNWLGKRFLYTNLATYKQLVDSIKDDVQSEQIRLTLICKYHAFNVTDSYWIKSGDETFEDIDIHKKHISEIVMDTALLGIMSTIEIKDMGADFVLDGHFPKTWIREEDHLSLVKGDITEDCRYVIAELRSQLILNQLDIPNCYYIPFTYKGENCTKTKCFTSEDIMLLTYNDFDIYKKYSKSDIWNKFLTEYNHMILFDYIIGNTDRHKGNYGLLVNAETNDIIKYAPLYDHNISMGTTVGLNQNLRTKDYKPTGKSFLDSALDALTYLKGNFNLDLKDVPDYVEERIKILKANYKGNLVSAYVKDQHNADNTSNKLHSSNIQEKSQKEENKITKEHIVKDLLHYGSSIGKTDLQEITQDLLSYATPNILKSENVVNCDPEYQAWTVLQVLNKDR